MQPEAQTITGRVVPLCLLTVVSLAVLVVVGLYLLSFFESDGPDLKLDRPSPFEPVAPQRAVTALTMNQMPPALSYRLDGERILEVAYSSPDSKPAFDLTVDEVEIVALDQQHWPPLFGDLRLHRFDLTFHDKSLPPWLKHLAGDALLTYRLNPERHTLDLPEVAIRVNDLGLAEMAVSFDGIDPSDPLSSLADSAISTLTLTLLDQGLATNGMALLAQTEGIPEETLRTNLSGLATLLRSESGYPFLRELLDAVETVMKHRGDGLVIEISARPVQSFPLKRFSRLKLSPLPDLSVLNELNLRIEAR